MSPRQKSTRTRWVWIAVVTVVAVALSAAAFGMFVIKRAAIDYRSEHDFSVRDPAFFGSAHALADPPPLEGNLIELLHNGDQSFGAMLEAIRSAKQSVNFEAFLFYSDSVGTKFCDAFCERAKAGVQVRVLLDAAGSGPQFAKKDEQRLKEAGCKFAYYHRLLSWRVDKINRRSHRRVLVVDGRMAFTGGVGFADQWAGNADSPDHWRDMHARLQGPVVAKLQGAFQQHWVRETGETVSGLGEFPPLLAAGPMKCQLLVSNSFSISPLSLVEAVAFASAEKTISITNAYCAPSENQVKLLTAAVKRGVNVRLLLPGKHNDQPLTKAAGRAAYGNLLRGGVKIYEYEPTMIHTKTMVVDGIFSVLGSSNFDARSSQINEELDVTIYDEKFGNGMDEVFDKDLAVSKEYRLEDFSQRGPWERFTEWVSLPFHSQL